jgi:hypothetical protein
MTNKWSIACAVLLLVLAGRARAGSFEALGSTVRFNAPQGYCELGDSPREKAIFQFVAKAVGPNVRLMKYLARCSELEAFKAGTVNRFEHFIEIQLVSMKGRYMVIPMERDTFITAVSGVDISHAMDKVDLNKQFHSRLKTDINLTKPDFANLGRDGMAVYYSMRFNMEAGASSIPVSGVSGLTLVNKLPVSFIVYDSSDDFGSRQDMLPTLMAMLRDVEANN